MASGSAVPVYTQGTFGAAFAAARKDLYPMAVFEWQGKQYTCLLREEKDHLESLGCPQGKQLTLADWIVKKGKSQATKFVITEALVALGICAAVTAGAVATFVVTLLTPSKAY
jgi:hypothetical protein